MERKLNTDDIIAALNANRDGKKGARLSTKTVYSVEEGDMTVVLPPQALAILRILLTNEGPWNEVELNELIQGYTEISEKQQPWQIFKYYRKKLIDSGWLVMMK